MKVLITGGTGFIGLYLAEKLLILGYKLLKITEERSQILLNNFASVV